MPVKYRIWLGGDKPDNPYEHSKGLRSWAYELLGSYSSQLRDELHHYQKKGPFTVSALNSIKERDDYVFFELSVLSDEVNAALHEAFDDVREDILLGNSLYKISKIDIVEKIDWKDMLRNNHSSGSFNFSFLTPTAHQLNTSIRKCLVTPNPELYYKDWLSRWNKNSLDIIIDEAEVEEVLDYMVVSKFSGGTKIVNTKALDRPFIGFVGQVTFQLLSNNNISPSIKQQITALSRFASLCGTGTETMRGMGKPYFWVKIIVR